MNEKECQNCGQKFTPEYRTDQKFCTYECGNDFSRKKYINKLKAGEYTPKSKFVN